MSDSSAWSLAKSSVKRWQEDEASRKAAELAYYTVFALAPLLVVAIALAGFAFGEQAAQGLIVGQLQGVVGPNAAELIETMLQNTRDTGAGVLATVIGVGALLLGATGIFAALQRSLNEVWGVERDPGGGIWKMIRTRLLAFTMVLLLGLLLVALLLTGILLPAVLALLPDLGAATRILTQIAYGAIVLGLVTVFFVLLYKVIPDAEIAWRDVWVGALATAVLFAIGALALSFYFGFVAVGSPFGAAGALIVLLVGIYYSTQILFLGAEFTQVWAERRGQELQPAEGSHRVVVQRMQPEDDAGRATGEPPRAGLPARRTPGSSGRPAPRAPRATPSPATDRSPASGRSRAWLYYLVGAFSALVAFRKMRGPGASD